MSQYPGGFGIGSGGFGAGDTPKNEQTFALTGKEAGIALARLMSRQLDLSPIDPIALRLFIRANWQQVSRLAHTIHKEE